MEAREDEAVIAGIRTDLETYEGERKAARRRAGWRLPVYLTAVAAAVVALAFGFNDFADSHEQWRSTPHLYLYVCALFACNGLAKPGRTSRRGWCCMVATASCFWR